MRQSNVLAMIGTTRPAMQYSYTYNKQQEYKSRMNMAYLLGPAALCFYILQN